MATFATHAAVATRLGRSLTSAEQNLATAVIEAVEGMIAESVGKDADWITDLDPIPTTLSQLCIEKAVSAVVNPTNVANESRTIGSVSRSVTYPRGADIGIFLSDEEIARVRRAVSGLSRGSGRMRSVVDDQLEQRYGVSPLLDS